MSKGNYQKIRRVSSEWSAGTYIPPMRPDEPTEFEVLAEKLGLKDDFSMTSSKSLRYWVNRNADYRYVPEWLLEYWGIRVTDTFSGI
jgi:hypothetical protein